MDQVDDVCQVGEVGEYGQVSEHPVKGRCCQSDAEKDPTYLFSMGRTRQDRHVQTHQDKHRGTANSSIGCDMIITRLEADC